VNFLCNVILTLADWLASLVHMFSFFFFSSQSWNYDTNYRSSVWESVHRCRLLCGKQSSAYSLEQYSKFLWGMSLSLCENPSRKTEIQLNTRLLSLISLSVWKPFKKEIQQYPSLISLCVKTPQARNSAAPISHLSENTQ
jgi:hypothetical protein